MFIAAREDILKAAKSPDFRGPLTTPTHRAQGKNPFCGDTIEVQLTIVEGTVKALSAQVKGCLVTSATWTWLAESLLFQSVKEAQLRLIQTLAFLEGQSVENILNLNLKNYRKPSPRCGCASLPVTVVIEALSIHDHL